MQLSNFILIENLLNTLSTTITSIEEGNLLPVHAENLLSHLSGAIKSTDTLLDSFHNLSLQEDMNLLFLRKEAKVVSEKLKEMLSVD